MTADALEAAVGAERLLNASACYGETDHCILLTMKVPVSILAVANQSCDWMRSVAAALRDLPIPDDGACPLTLTVIAAR